MMLLAISAGWKTAIMIGLMLVVFYFFFLRPQSQQAKKEAAYRDNLKKDDEVMLSNGIHAKVVSTEGTQNQAIVEVAPGTRIKVAKGTMQPIPERKAKRK